LLPEQDGPVSTTSTARVPQEERTRLMRQRLLEATVDCLVEFGWSGTSTTLVSQRAGVSRGAQLHHFPTKNDLVIAAVEHLSEVRGAELREAATRLPAGRRRTRAVLEMLADHFTSPVFTAALELWVAARTDAALHGAVVPLEQRIGREIHRRTVELLGADETRPGARELVQATLDLVRGLGLATTISDDTARRGRILDQWARVLDDQLAPGDPSADAHRGTPEAAQPNHEEDGR
jgi:AcrR family transcriptional regulator